MEWGTGLSPFHYEQLGSGYTHVPCILVGTDKPCSTKLCAGPFPRHGDTPRDARGKVTKLKMLAYISFGVGVRIILHMVE